MVMCSEKKIKISFNCKAGSPLNVKKHSTAVPLHLIEIQLKESYKLLEELLLPRVLCGRTAI